MFALAEVQLAGEQALDEGGKAALQEVRYTGVLHEMLVVDQF